jgi:hypothetical protein
VKPETMKVPEENRGETRQDIGMGKEFWTPPPKHRK